MQYYAVGALEVTDAAWVPTYVEQVTPIVERYGGRYLARTGNVEAIERDEEFKHWSTQHTNNNNNEPRGGKSLFETVKHA